MASIANIATSATGAFMTSLDGVGSRLVFIAGIDFLAK